MNAPVHAAFRQDEPVWAMANRAVKLLMIGLCGFFSLGAGAAWADGFRFGGWGPRFGGPYFGGPRFDGPRAHDYDYEPEPLDAPLDAPLDPRLDPPRGPPRGPPSGPPPDDVMRDMAPRPDGPRLCYSPAETRERVAGLKLREPFALMRKAATLTHADPLAGKLCRWNDLDIYEISLLRSDGRVIHVYMNAATGAVVGALNTH
jgi:hypothetical protein